MYGPYRVIRNAPYPLRRPDASNAMQISKDGGALAAPASVPTETPAASGIWYGELSATEMAADHIMVLGVNLTSVDTFALIPEPCFDSGVAQAGSSTTITLRAAAPAYGLTGTIIEIVRGTGKDQTPRLITAYDTGTKIATVRPDWSTNPDNTSVYIVKQQDKVNLMYIDGVAAPAQYISEFWLNAYWTGTFSAGCTTSVLNTNMTGRGTDNLVNSAIMNIDGNNDGIMRKIIGYNDGSGQMTVTPPYATAPSNGDRFSVQGFVG